MRLHILHHAARGEVHGAWMATELAEHGYRISPGSLYPTLHKMEAEGSPPVEPAGHRRSGSPFLCGDGQGAQGLESTKRQLRELAREVLGDETP